jgi:hypothetical protein
MLTQYDISKTYNSFWGGISDDDFVGTENSVQDMDGIEVQIEERFISADTAYYIEEDRSLAWVTWFQNTPYGNFVSNLSSVMLNGTTLSLWGTAWDGVISYGSGAEQQNYFFERTLGVKIANYNGSSIGAFLSSGYPTLSSQITAIGWHIQNILFAKKNILYYFDVSTNTTSIATTLTPWTEVLRIHAVNLDSIVVVGKNWNTTQVYELEFTWWAYNIVSKIENNDFTVLWAVGNIYDVFLIGTNWIYQYQWRQIQHVKYVELSLASKVTYDKWVVILSGNNLYKFSRVKPWRNFILTRIGIDNFDLVSNNYLLDIISGGFRTYIKSTWYKRINTITLRPLDWGMHEIPKQDLSYRIGLITPEWNTPTAETQKCWIKIEVQTDEMEKDIGSFYVTVFEEYENFCWFREIWPQEVAKAIEIAGYKSQFWYARTRITLYAGAQIGSTWIYSKTPKLFDITLSANSVKR